MPDGAPYVELSVPVREQFDLGVLNVAANAPLVVGDAHDVPSGSVAFYLKCERVLAVL